MCELIKQALRKEPSTGRKGSILHIDKACFLVLFLVGGARLDENRRGYDDDDDGVGHKTEHHVTGC